MLTATLLLASCSYGAARTHVEIHNAAAEPGTHRFAVAVEYRLVRDPTGFLSTFPNGGVPRVLEREARVYMVDIDDEMIVLAAQLADFADIPHPKRVGIRGWENGSVYVTLFGYGGGDWTGDDMSDERRLNYRIAPNGEVEEVGLVPDDLAVEQQTGPLPEPPFLRLSPGYRDINIGVDGRPRDAERRAKFILNPETGEPRLLFESRN